MFDADELKVLEAALCSLERGFRGLPGLPHSPDSDEMRAVLLETARRLRDNYPYFHPLYAGQMLKPPHPVARLAYALSLWLNPNNHALDGGRASSQMEKEAVADLARMFGWQTHLGHLTGGGTMANLEALWVAGRLQPGRAVAASEHAHYTHRRLCEVLGIPFVSIACDGRMRMDPGALEAALATGEVGTVVATLGTTVAGSVDPVDEILQLKEQSPFRLHADAAYGGYFGLVADRLDIDARRAFAALPQADSIAIDPHKHGLQPYGCGCVLFADPTVGRYYNHDSPYTYFSSAELHLGEISLECSRPGAAAVALWATQQLLPLLVGGEFAHGLGRSCQAAATLARKIEADGRFALLLVPQLDIVLWAVKGRSAQESSQLARRIFEEAARRHLHLALARLPARLVATVLPGLQLDSDEVTCLRACLMKPEHLDWLADLWQLLDAATTEAEQCLGLARTSRDD